jgi:hypothetical protein
MISDWDLKVRVLAMEIGAEAAKRGIEPVELVAHSPLIDDDRRAHLACSALVEIERMAERARSPLLADRPTTTQLRALHQCSRAEAPDFLRLSGELAGGFFCQACGGFVAPQTREGE